MKPYLLYILYKSCTVYLSDWLLVYQQEEMEKAPNSFEKLGQCNDLFN